MQSSASPSPLKQKKNRLSLYLGIGCGALLLLALCCAAAGLIYSYLNPIENEISLGTLEVNASGGTFENGDLRLEFPAGAALQPLRFDVLCERRAPQGDADGLTYRSIGYTLRGPLHLLSGEMQISLKVPRAQLEDATTLLVLEEDVVTPSWGDQRAAHLLPATADPAAGVLRAAVRFEPPDGAGSLPQGGVFPARLDKTALYLQSQTSAITIRAETGWVYDMLVSDHFRVSYRGRIVDRQMVEQGVRVLEDQYQKLTSMGFTFGGVQRIDVYLKPLKDKAGQFVPSKLGVSYCTLELANRFFYDADFYNEGVNELKVTAGHELMHLAQFAADPRWAYRKAVNPMPTLWLDEAAATWFEPLAIENPAYLPPNAVQNKNFVRTPLYGAVLEEAQDHGYGASFFIRFLTERYGTQLVADFYRELPNTRSQTAAEAFDRVLRNYSTYPGLEYLNFLETYHVNPQILSGFSGPDVLYTAVVTARNLTESGDAQVNFNLNPELAKLASTESGLLFGEKPATLQVSFPLGGLSATALQVSLAQDESTAKAFSQPVQVSVTVSAPVDAGVLVYSAGANGQMRPLAGAPFEYLSSEDPATQSGDRLLVENFSLDGSAGSYKTLLLIPFSLKTNSFTSGEPVRNVTLQVTLWGQILSTGGTPEQPGITQPPAETTPASGQSDHACAGMTVEKMRQPSVLNKRCWIACFGIGSQVTPSDAEIQECIDKHQ